MKILLRLEELGMFAFSIFMFYQMDLAGWYFWAFLLAPDLGAIGYLISPSIGAISYNLTHHKGLAVGLWVLGVFLQNIPLQLTGIIMFGHASIDRVLGYGLKYPDRFEHTHLGYIGKGKE